MFSKVVLLGIAGGAAAYFYGKRRVHAAEPSEDEEPEDIPDSYAADPRDLVQTLDELNPLHVEELGVEAMSMADAESDLELAETEAFLEEEEEEEDEEVLDRTLNLDDIEQRAHDVGDLYGSHTPRATDREHPDADAAFAEGQNWLEALETDAAEGGPVPEEGIEDVVDDEDVYNPPHASDMRDRPVADRGSGGPGGI
ncbi:MAG: hypothetical protein SFX73_20955 [Kofleriaceae bacterium]|nr:hypothetical protein [Kofleriaceae bacterium]